MKRPIKEDFLTEKAFLRAIEDFFLAQHDAHVLDWYWYNRLKSRNDPDAKIHGTSIPPD
jgi:hypothetical protein